MRILIIKLGAIGDVLRTTAILPGIKEKYSESEITWITKQNAISLIKNKGFIDLPLVYNSENINHLKNKEFDLIINLDEDFEACSLASSIKTKILGFYIDRDKKIKPTESAEGWYNMSALGKHPRNDILKKNNKLTYQEHMFKIIGIKPKDHSISLRLNVEQKKIAKDFMRRYNINSEDILIGLNTGSSKRWPLKRLPIIKTAKLAEIIHKKLKAKIILFGGPDEIERNNQIIALAKVPIINAGCGNDLKEFPALISLCHVLVTSDSLGMHIGIALKRRIIAFFGPTSSSEIELYSLGEKVVPKKGCICCYRTDDSGKNNCIDYISVEDLFNAIKRNLPNESASIIVTSFKEKSLDKTIASLINQNLTREDQIIIVSPDGDVRNLVAKYRSYFKDIIYIQDPGKGKSYALNLAIKKIKKEILILTDGDVILGKSAIKEIKNKFKDPSIGCVTGRPISLNKKNNMLGYWSHLLYDAGAHRIRSELAKEDKFLEGSGYLFAFRNIIKDFPIDVAEDTVIPYFFYQKGYKIGYADKALVYVKNPTNLMDWINQKKRTAKSHERLYKYVDTRYIPRIKSFKNEAVKGVIWAIAYSSSFKEFIWTLALFLARLYVWIQVLLDIKIKKHYYSDNWNRIESTK